jgi:hypothetical protein
MTCIFSRSEWEGDIAPYSPRFHDGWSPGIITFQDDQPEFGADNNEDFVLNKMSQHDSRVMTTKLGLRFTKLKIIVGYYSFSLKNANQKLRQHN